MTEVNPVGSGEHHFEPMTVGMILDRAFRLYTENFSLMFGITAVFNLPLIVIQAIPTLLINRRGSPVPLVAVLVSGLISLLTLMVVYPLVTGAITKAVSDKYLGNPVTTAGALAEAWGSVGTLVVTQVVAGLIIIGGFMLLIVPGILWALSYSLIAPVVMVEAADRKTRRVYSLTGEPKTAPVTMDSAEIRRRSWNLVKGNRGKVFIVVALFFVMTLLLQSGGNWVTSLVFDAASSLNALVQSVVASFVSILISPLQTIAITLLYYDFRIRKEGFDLEMLSQAIGSPSVQA
ncbi:MAG TPA: hypothetical protein VGK48_14515 [Terriglobia bacterium]|jgi:hypothetical protein